MRKLTYLIALLSLLATLVGLVITVMELLERRKARLEDDDYEQELYHGGQEYYAEDFNLDSSDEDAAQKPEEAE